MSRLLLRRLASILPVAMAAKSMLLGAAQAGERLVAVGERGIVVLSEDAGRTYAFPIRKGVVFHDGSTMTPEDVRYSLLRFLLMDRSGCPRGT